MVPITILYKVKILNLVPQSRPWQSNIKPRYQTHVCRNIFLFTVFPRFIRSYPNIIFQTERVHWGNYCGLVCSYHDWWLYQKEYSGPFFFQGITLYRFVTSVIFCVLPLIFRFVGASAFFDVLLGNHGLFGTLWRCNCHWSV